MAKRSDRGDTDGPSGKAKTTNRRKRRSNSATHANSADWSEVDAELIRKVVAAVAKDDGAIRFGYSRDGGAFGVGIYGDGEPFTEYIPVTGDIEGHLRELIEDYGEY